MATESTHAQEHWLRLVANDCIRGLLTPSRPIDREPLVLARDLIGNAEKRSATALEYLVHKKDPAQALLYAESSISALLRAAVILRREETRR